MEEDDYHLVSRKSIMNRNIFLSVTAFLNFYLLSLKLYKFVPSIIFIMVQEFLLFYIDCRLVMKEWHEVCYIQIVSHSQYCFVEFI